AMTTSLIGARVPRKEDYRFLTGAGQYTDDVALAGQTYAAFVRSPHAHAVLRSIKTDKAKKAAGVVAIYTGADLAAGKVGGLPCGWLITDVKGQPMKEPPYPPLEPRSANASYSRADDSYTLYVASQNPHVERLLMTAFVLGLPESKVRVVSADVGGGFGSKIYLYAEDVVVTWAARQLARPVKWTSDRSEAFVSDAHGRAHITTAELALDKDGKFLAMRVRTTANLGAYLSTFASCIPTILYA